jgi:hypothetical protein
MQIALTMQKTSHNNTRDLKIILLVVNDCSLRSTSPVAVAVAVAVQAA